MPEKPIVRKVFICGYVLWQQWPDGSCPDEALLVHVDAGGTMVIEQREHSLVFNRETLPELIRLLRRVDAEYREKEAKAAEAAAKA